MIRSGEGTLASKISEIGTQFWHLKPFNSEKQTPCFKKASIVRNIFLRNVVFQSLNNRPLINTLSEAFARCRSRSLLAFHDRSPLPRDRLNPYGKLTVVRFTLKPSCSPLFCSVGDVCWIAWQECILKSLKFTAVDRMTNHHTSPCMVCFKK